MRKRWFRWFLAVNAVFWLGLSAAPVLIESTADAQSTGDVSHTRGLQVTVCPP